MTKQTEVLIVGGGMAGICAALSAAETGKEVILLEKSALLGGNATKSNVGTICGAYYRSLAGNIIPAGNSFTRNFIKEILHRHQLEKPINYYNGLHLVPYEWSILLEFLNNQLAKWDNIKVYLNTEIESVLNADNRINTVQTKISGEQITFTPQSIVDCSGNGVVSQLAELEHLSSHQYQAATQVFRLTGVKPTSEFSLNMAIKKNMMVLIDENEWPESFKVMSAVPGSLRKDKVDIKLTLPDNITDNSAENVKLLAKAKGYIHEILPVLKDKIESLREAEIERIFPEPGVRVLKRSKGVYTLSENDVLNCTKDENGVAAGVWPIEHWETTGNVEMVYFAPEDHYLIPADCLQSGQVENLFFAGKNISATDRAIASARVIGTCIQTGYAAGKLSTCKNADERKEMIRRLHTELKEGSREYI